MAMWSARPHESARRGARVAAVGERLDARDKRALVALGPLDEPAAVHRQVVAPLGPGRGRAWVLDHLAAGFRAGLDPAAIIKAKEARRIGSLPLHHALKRQPGSAAAVAAPVHQHPC